LIFLNVSLSILPSRHEQEVARTERREEKEGVESTRKDWKKTTSSETDLQYGLTTYQAENLHQGLLCTTVSIPQLILDLLDEGGPCEEAARKLIDSFHGEQQ